MSFKQNAKQAHALLEMIPAERLNVASSLLEAMVEPLARSLASAAVEEEEVTPETAAALERARASLDHEDIGTVVPVRSKMPMKIRRY